VRQAVQPTTRQLGDVSDVIAQASAGERGQHRPVVVVHQHHTIMQDPDGNEFCVESGPDLMTA
jgi:hypothetical protein